jgi:ATP-dependent Clp protease protease subunit
VKFWNFSASDDGEDVELRIEGEIVSGDDAWIYEWFGIPVASPNAFRSELAGHKGKNITVWIDSWGGDVFAGVGMFNALKEHKGKVTVKIDGKAVSAATLPAMAGDQVLMSPGSIFMIHNPWTRVVGESKDMRHTADVLDEVKDSILNIYQVKSKKSRKELSSLMDNEEWFSARKAVNEGFADDILYASGQDEPIKDSFSINRHAIMNSADSVMRRFFEQWQKMQTTGNNQQSTTEQPPEAKRTPRAPLSLYAKYHQLQGGLLK